MGHDRDQPLPWSVAMERALYGDGGFYRRTPGPAAHFRTSVTASPRYAHAIRALAQAVDRSLGKPARFDLVDVGAGQGALLTAVLARGVPHRWRLTAVERADRPPHVPARVAFRPTLADEAFTGLLIANEWLDVVPLDVVEHDRLVLVDPSGRESPGPGVGAHDAAWLARWWPEGRRREVGRPRDEQWASAVRSLRRGVAVAVDYGHERANRPEGGTLTGYARGRQVTPVPDGTVDLTAHVAWDSCAAAGVATGASAPLRLTQREALRRLGVSGAGPGPGPAGLHPPEHPRRLLRALAMAGEEAALLAPGGLGGFGWLVQTRDCPPPAPLRPEP